MKNIKTVLKCLITVGLMGTVSLAYEGEIDDNDMYTPQTTILKNMNKKESLTVLGEILSPFEDMTEYALNQDLNGMKKSYKEIENNEDIFFLKQSIKPDKLQLLSQNIFKESVFNFKFTKVIAEQIHIENLDYMGFKLRALLG